ncbi:MAG: 3-isopropylmalate dehydratase small subunit [Nitrososphaerales archaeon]
MDTIFRGKVHRYGENVDTDVIIPGKYLKEMDPQKLALHALEGIDPQFVNKVKSGDFILAGRNFGCGSSREHAPLALRYSGVKAVLAPSFARIFYRNAIDGGHLIPIEITSDTYEQIADGDEIEVDLGNQTVRNITQRKEYEINPFPELVLKILESGGLFKYKAEA